MSPNDSYPQHVVTAVIVAHDGASWLPSVLDAVIGQARPVQRIVAVDTGSRDRSGSVLAGKLGQQVVFGMDRATGYAAAVHRALRHKAASAALPAQDARGSAERVEWIWLLHDDSEPAPDALEQLLRGAAETPSAAVLGPKVRDYTDRRVILEAGLAMDTVGRRITGIEPREVDQGQHDGDRDCLAVSSAGMLVRRDVWDRTGGFDPGMALFSEDIDLCWRVHAAGYRVRVITDAVVYHVQAASKRKRAISVGRREKLLSRRNSLLTLLGNLPGPQMLGCLIGNVTISVLRTLFYLVAKRPAAALDESAAVSAVLFHPLRLGRTRRRRARGRRAAYGQVRAEMPQGRSVRRMAEFIAASMSHSARADTAGMHHASDDPSEDDSLLTDTGIVQRVLTSPSVLLLVGLLVVALVAERSLLGAGLLGGGALPPAWGGSAGLWGQYLQGFHPAGIGSTTPAPPYVAMVGLLATVLFGKPWLAIDVILLGCVPLAGATALLAVRRVTRSVPVRIWTAAAYALLPVATGAIAAGRFGTAVAFVLLPVICLQASRMFTESAKLARRAAWATALTVTVASAFVPLLWPMAAVAAVLAVAAFRSNRRRRLLPNLAIAVLAPPLLLLPWTVQVLSHPSLLLLEAGVQRQGLASQLLPARSLLLLNPGGPGVPPFWVAAGLAVAALAALLAPRRRVLVRAGWIVAVFGLAVATVVSKISVIPPGSDRAITGWPGPALLVAAAGLLLAVAAGADGLGRVLSVQGRTGTARLAGGRGFAVLLLTLAAVSAPLAVAGLWLLHGVSGPLKPAAAQVVTEPVAVTANDGRQLGTLVLTDAGGHISYSLLRTDAPDFAASGLTPPPAAERALSTAVAELVAPAGGQAVNQGQLLARLDIGFVLMKAPLNTGLRDTLDNVPGLRPVTVNGASRLWQLTSLPSMARVLEPDGTIVPVRWTGNGVAGVPAPKAGGILELAEPSGAWTAALNGQGLTPMTSPAGSWAQAFRLPAGGGTLTVGRREFWHNLLVTLELLALAVVAVLALPGIKSTAEQQAVLEAASQSAEPAGDEDDDEARPAARPGAARGLPKRKPASRKRRPRQVPARSGRVGRSPVGVRGAASPAAAEAAAAAGAAATGAVAAGAVGAAEAGSRAGRVADGRVADGRVADGRAGRLAGAVARTRHGRPAQPDRRARQGERGVPAQAAFDDSELAGTGDSERTARQAAGSAGSADRSPGRRLLAAGRRGYQHDDGDREPADRRAPDEPRAAAAAAARSRRPEPPPAPSPSGTPFLDDDLAEPGYQEPDYARPGGQAADSRWPAETAARDRPDPARQWRDEQARSSWPSDRAPDSWPSGEQPATWSPADSQRTRSYSQPGYDRGPGYQQPGHDERGYDAPYGPPAGYQQADDEPRYRRPAHGQHGYPPPDRGQAGYDSAGYDSAGYDSAGSESAGYDSAGPAGGGYGGAGPGGADHGSSEYDRPSYDNGGDGPAGYSDRPWPGDDDGWTAAPDDDLEALPPIDEVHHDWPSPAGDRATGHWPAPDRDREGDRW